MPPDGWFLPRKQVQTLAGEMQLGKAQAMQRLGQRHGRDGGCHCEDAPAHCSRGSRKCHRGARCNPMQEPCAERDENYDLGGDRLRSQQAHRRRRGRPFAIQPDDTAQ
jgi:hypothetical protein